VRANTLRVVGLTIGIVVVGLVLFGYSSTRMLRPLKNLTSAASAVAHGDLDVTLPARRSRDEVGRLSTTFDAMLEGLRQRDFIRDTFGRYLSKEIVEELLGSPDGLKMGGELRQVTILVSDLRGFTSLASHLPPQHVIEILNRYLERMVDIIEHYRGTVDEFQGDGILAFFGAPLAAPDDAERAVACAIAMQTALAEINAEQHQRHFPALHMGIGINTGEVIVGNIGSEKRTKYGAVGSAINEAYRIESYTVAGQVLVSPSVYASLHDKLHVHSRQEVHFKGLETAVTLYDITGLHGPYAGALPEKTPETFVPLPTPLSVVCFPVEGKTVSATAITGSITHLSAAAAEVLLTDHIAPHTNLKVQLVCTDAAELPELYAKVLTPQEDNATGSGTHVQLQFTSLPQATATFLTTQRLAALEAMTGSAV
jgi:class 3 adenylate cyclase